MTGDRDLVRRFQRGDADAAWHMLTTHGPSLHRVAYAITGDVDRAEDVVQDALLRVLRRGELYRGGCLAAWLRAVVLRVALNARRSERRTVDRAVEYATDRPGAAAGPGDPLLRAALRQEIDRLPETERTIFILVELEGWSHAETGAALGLSEAASRQRLFHARQRLRAALEPLKQEYG